MHSSKLYQKFVEGLDKKSKKFRLFRGTEHHQELDLETVRNIIVNKISKILAQKMNRPVEEVEDNIRLREIKQGGATGNYFGFKYSVYNRPLMPWYTTLDPNDLFNYQKPGFDVTKHEPDEKEEEPEDTEVDSEDDIDSDIKNDDDEDKVNSDIDSLDDDENEEENDGELTTEPDDSLYDGQLSESNIMKSFNKFRKSNIVNLTEQDVDVNEGFIGDTGQYVLKSMELQKKERKLQQDKLDLGNLLVDTKDKNLFDIHNLYKSYLRKKGADRTAIEGVSRYTPQQINDLINNDISIKDQEIQQIHMDRSVHQDTVSPSVRKVGDFIDPNKSTLVQKWRNRRIPSEVRNSKKGDIWSNRKLGGTKGIPRPTGMVRDPRTGKMVPGGIGGDISGALDTYAPGVKPIVNQAGEVAKQTVSPLVWGTGKMLGKLIGKGVSAGYNKLTGKGE